MDKNIVQAILANIWKLVLFIISIIEDITTFLREAGKGSAFSSRRLFALTFVVATIYSISLAIRSFTDLLLYGWIAALIFIPAALCGLLAIIFSYFASVTDFKTAIDSVGSAIAAKKQDKQ